MKKTILSLALLIAIALPGRAQSKMTSLNHSFSQLVKSEIQAIQLTGYNVLPTTTKKVIVSKGKHKIIIDEPGDWKPREPQVKAWLRAAIRAAAALYDVIISDELAGCESTEMTTTIVVDGKETTVTQKIKNCRE